MPTDVVVEGKVDAAVLRELCPTMKETVRVPEERGAGRDQAIPLAVTTLSLLGPRRVALVLDLNSSN